MQKRIKIYYNDARNHRCSTDTQFHYVWPQVYYFKGASYNIIDRMITYTKHQTKNGLAIQWNLSKVLPPLGPKLLAAVERWSYYAGSTECERVI